MGYGAAPLSDQIRGTNVMRTRRPGPSTSRRRCAKIAAKKPVLLQGARRFVAWKQRWGGAGLRFYFKKSVFL